MFVQPMTIAKAAHAVKARVDPPARAGVQMATCASRIATAEVGAASTTHATRSASALYRRPFLYRRCRLPKPHL